MKSQHGFIKGKSDLSNFLMDDQEKDFILYIKILAKHLTDFHIKDLLKNWRVMGFRGGIAGG